MPDFFQAFETFGRTSGEMLLLISSGKLLRLNAFLGSFATILQKENAFLFWLLMFYLLPIGLIPIANLILMKFLIRRAFIVLNLFCLQVISKLVVVSYNVH